MIFVAHIPSHTKYVFYHPLHVCKISERFIKKYKNISEKTDIIITPKCQKKKLFMNITSSLHFFLKKGDKDSQILKNDLHTVNNAYLGLKQELIHI